MAKDSIDLAKLAEYIRTLPITVADIKHTDMWTIAAKMLEGFARDCFNFSRSPSGAPWSPLRHPRPRGGSKPLLDTGMLRASLTSKGRGHIETVTPTSLEWGTNLIQASTHQYGAIITPKKGKFLAIPVSVEAQRAGSPRKFPDAKTRLGWRVTNKGGVVYEKPGAKKSKKKSTRGSKKKKARFGKFIKKLKRLGKKALKGARLIAKLSLRMSKYMDKLRKMRAGTAQYVALYKKILALKKKIKTEKAKKEKPPKDKKVKSIVTTKVGGVDVIVHYFLTKSVKIPARPFLGINREMSDKLSNLISTTIIETMIRKGYDKMK